MTNTPTYLACLAACGLWAAAPTSADSAPFDTFKDCDVCPEMIELPLGEFIMGAPEGESQLNFHWDENGWRPATEDDPFIAYQEGPVHKVTIDVPFAIGRNEVTYDEWMACVNDGGCGGYIPDTTIVLPANRGLRGTVQATGNHPIINVSFFDMMSYADWLNHKVEANVYRLPTEAEWEYAARAGTQTPFAQGVEITTDQSNFNGLGTAEMFNWDRPDLISRGAPVPVDQLDAANAWGLRHMSGNVLEQTLSCYSKRHKVWPRSSIHLQQSITVDSCQRVTRGGAFHAQMDYARVAVRGLTEENWRSREVGFRLVRAIKSP